MNHETLGLASAYKNTTSNNQEPKYTTWKIREEGEVCHTIDYVFFSQAKFNVEAVLDMPSGEQIGEARIPSMRYPSDHFSLEDDERRHSLLESQLHQVEVELESVSVQLEEEAPIEFESFFWNFIFFFWGDIKKTFIRFSLMRD
uniref:Nocturnin n=1 Tax=Cacopsylla melanoneura TaxID=428564 RepID=A0A8D9FK52_9HEMI